MDEFNEFEARLDAALVMNGVNNAQFAANFGPNGQQLVHGWRKRGRIGQASVPKVRTLLPVTNMTWLQEGSGEARNLTNQEKFSLGPRESQTARPNMHTLAAAVRVITVDEQYHGKFNELRFAERLWDYYEQLASGVQQVDLITQVIAGKNRGEHNDGQSNSSEKGAARR